MDYKSLIKSRKLRIKIMQFLSFVPDEWMIKLQYRMKTGRKLNLKNPQRFTEKLQWYKLYYRDPLMAQCADKFEVRKYVEACGLGHTLNELYGVYNSPEEIDFGALPNAFVAKDTLGGGGNSVIIVTDKTAIDIEQLKRQMQEWVDEPTNKKHPGREWVYEGRKHRIIIEKLLSGDESGDLPDYKFYMFDGELACFYVRKNYLDDHEGKVHFYDEQCTPIEVALDYSSKSEEVYALPEYIYEMISCARNISQCFPHARVDFYLSESKIYFGEITFFNASGYFTFKPDEFDFELGKQFVSDLMGEDVVLRG